MKRTEIKTKAQSWAVFLLSLVGLTVLGTLETDYVSALPDWLEAPAYAGIVAVAGWLTGYNVHHRPDNLSDSAVEAIRKRMGETFAGIRPRKSGESITGVAQE